MSEIKISATSAEKWNEIKTALDKLPKDTLNQIESVESGLLGITCHLKAVFDSDNKIYIPKDLVTQIADFGDYIGIYCGDFFLKARKEKFNYNYIFVTN